MKGDAAARPPEDRSTLAYVRSVLFAVWMFGAALGLGIGCLPLMLGPQRWATAPIRLWAKATLWGLRIIVGADVEVRGRERLPPGGCLVAAKHQSMLDVVVALTLAPRPCFVLKRELMWIPIFGWYAWKSGMIAIDRSGGPAQVRAMAQAARCAVARGRQVLIYPEGTRRAPGDPPAYKRGVGLLYADLATPCAMMATYGGHVWPAHGMLKYAGRARFEVLPPIAPGLSRKAFMARLERELEAGSAALLTGAGVNGG